MKSVVSVVNIIVFYISSHGYGHLTRSLAIIKKVLETSDTNVYIGTESKQLNFARTYLYEFKERVITSELTTDIGLITQNKKLSVDQKGLELKLLDFIKSWESIVKREVNQLRKYNIKMIVTDISPIGPLVASNLKLMCYAVSNFTWVEIYEKLGLKNRITVEFINSYKHVDKFIEYSLRLPTTHRFGEINRVGFISREIDFLRVKAINEIYGGYILFTFGQSAVLNKIYANDYQGNILAFDGVEISAPYVSILPIDTIDTQNYIAASRLVVSKAGWGIIAEAVVTGVPLVLIERPDVYEDTYMIEQLKRQRLAISIKEQDIFKLDINKIYSEAMEYIDFELLKQFKNDLNSVTAILMND